VKAEKVPLTDAEVAQIVAKAGTGTSSIAETPAVRPTETPRARTGGKREPTLY